MYRLDKRLRRKIRQGLEKAKIEYFEYQGYFRIHICNVYEPLHSYVDWENDIDTDYDTYIKDEFPEELRYHITNGDIHLILCDECCGCGDW